MHGPHLLVQDSYASLGAAVMQASGGFVLDKLSAPALGAYSIYRRLRAGYAGAAFRVRRASDNTFQDIGFSGPTVNLAALTAFCTGTIGYAHVVYDQSGNGKDLSMPSNANNCKVYDSATGPTTGGLGGLRMQFRNGTTMRRNDALGISATPTLTMAIVLQATATGDVGCASIGNLNTSADNIRIYYALRFVSTQRFGAEGATGSTSYRRGQFASLTDAMHSYVHTRTGSDMANGSIYRDNIETATYTSNSATISLVTNSTFWGSDSNSPSTANMDSNFLAFWGVQLTAADRTVLEGELALYK